MIKLQFITDHVMLFILLFICTLLRVKFKMLTECHYFIVVQFLSKVKIEVFSKVEYIYESLIFAGCTVKSCEVVSSAME